MPSPASFSDFIKKEFQSRLVDFLSADVSSESQEFLEYQNKLRNSLPSILLDELMNDLLLHLSEQRESDLMLRALQLLLSARTRRLRLYPFDYSHLGRNCLNINKLVNLIETRKPKLTHLEMNYDYSNDSFLQGCLKEFPSLKSLSVKSYYFASSLMEIILRCCPALEELNLVLQHFNCKNLHIESWPEHKTLCVFTIENLSNFYSLAPTTGDEIFKKLPNLQILETNNNFVNLILSKEIPLNLKSLLTSESTLCKGLQNLHELRPDTNSICLGTLEDPILECLANFRQLNELSIFFCNEAELLDVLETCGSTLTHLMIHVIDAVNLSRVLQLCPNLEHLNIHLTFRVQVDQVVPQRKLRHFRLDEAPANIIDIFKCLTSLEAVEIASWSSYSPSQLDDVISVFQNIKTLRIYRNCNFTLRCLQQIIKRCHQLEELLIPSENDHFNLKQVELFLQKNNLTLKIITPAAFTSIHKHSRLEILM